MLQIEHLSFDVRDDGRQAEILSDISFNVADGEMLVITGPNGGGKSTLAKLLNPHIKVIGVEPPQAELF